MKKGLEVRKDFANMQKLFKALIEADEYRVKVGIIGGKAGKVHKGGFLTNAEIGYKHEFGELKSSTFKYKGKKITIKGLPQRSFLRMPMTLKGREITKKLKSQKLKIMEMIVKNQSLEPVLERVGILAENIVQEAFATSGFGQWAKNINPEYVKLKGSDTPLIDTGQLRRSISSKVYKK